MPLTDLNQLDLGKPSGPKAKGGVISLSDIAIKPRTKKKSPTPEISKQTPEDLYNIWSKDPNAQNLGNIVDSLRSVIDKNIYALVPKPTPATNSKARLLAINAIKTYKPKQKAKLVSWVYQQLQPLKRYAQQSAPVSVSERMYRQQSELFKFEEDFYDNHNRFPSDRELADLMKISKKQIGRIRGFNKARLHESQQYGNDPEGTTTASETVGTVPDRTEELIDLFYDSLGPTEQAILEYRLGIRGRKQLSNSATALKVKLSPARVSQISGDLADRLDEFKEDATGVIL